MKGVTINELKRAAAPVQIAVQSLEGDMYISHAVEGGKLTAIVTDGGDRVLARSIAQMHAMLRDVPVADARLMVDSPYDEMIGIASSRGVTGIPLAW